MSTIRTPAASPWLIFPVPIVYRISSPTFHEAKQYRMAAVVACGRVLVNLPSSDLLTQRPTTSPPRIADGHTLQATYIREIAQARYAVL